MKQMNGNDQCILDNLVMYSGMIRNEITNMKDESVKPIDNMCVNLNKHNAI
jgi:hypothetical protein